MASRPFASLTSDLIKRDVPTVAAVPAQYLGPDGKIESGVAIVNAHDPRARPYVHREIDQ